MLIKCLEHGMYGSNCYVVAKNGEGIIIDAGVEEHRVMDFIEENNITVKYIFITHGHIDHICALNKLYADTKAKVLIHGADANAFIDPAYNLSLYFEKEFVYSGEYECIRGGEVIKFGDLEAHIIHTPGHSPGCVCIRVEGNVFTGDTLFRRSIGRTDLPNGSEKDIKNSINSKLMRLDDEVIVYPGHGSKSDIGYERGHNPYI